MRSNFSALLAIVFTVSSNHFAFTQQPQSREVTRARARYLSAIQEARINYVRSLEVALKASNNPILITEIAEEIKRVSKLTADDNGPRVGPFSAQSLRDQSVTYLYKDW